MTNRLHIFLVLLCHALFIFLISIPTSHEKKTRLSSVSTQITVREVVIEEPLPSFEPLFEPTIEAEKEQVTEYKDINPEPEPSQEIPPPISEPLQVVEIKKQEPKKEEPKKKVTKKVEPKKTAPRSKVTAPSKPVKKASTKEIKKGKAPQKKTLSKKSVSDEKILKLMKESLSLLEGEKKEKSFSRETLSLPSLKSESPSFPAATRYEEELTLYLKHRLKLPEYGDVKIKLTLTQEGKVERLEIEKAASQKNKKAVEEKLPTLRFPPFDDRLQGEKKHTFSLTLKLD